MTTINHPHPLPSFQLSSQFSPSSLQEKTSWRNADLVEVAKGVPGVAAAAFLSHFPQAEIRHNYLVKNLGYQRAKNYFGASKVFTATTKLSFPQRLSVSFYGAAFFWGVHKLYNLFFRGEERGSLATNLEDIAYLWMMFGSLGWAMRKIAAPLLLNIFKSKMALKLGMLSFEFGLFTLFESFEGFSRLATQQWLAGQYNKDQCLQMGLHAFTGKASIERAAFLGMLKGVNKAASWIKQDFHSNQPPAHYQTAMAGPITFTGFPVLTPRAPNKGPVVAMMSGASKVGGRRKRASDHIKIYHGDQLVKTGRQLGKQEMARLDDAMIKTSLDHNGILTLGSKRIAGFKHAPLAEVEVKIKQGVATEIEVLAPERPEKHEFVLCYHQGKLVDSTLQNLRKSRLAGWGEVTVRKKLKSSGMLAIAGQNVLLENFPHHPVDIDLRSGVVTEVRVLQPSARLIDAKHLAPGGRYEMALIYEQGNDAHPRRLKDFYLGAFVQSRLPELDGVTVKKRNGQKGSVKIGGRQWATLRDYGHHPIEVDFTQGVPTEIRVYEKTDKLVNAHQLVPNGKIELGLIYQTGRLVDSFYGQVGGKRLTAWGKVTVKTRLNAFGYLSLEGETKAQFTKLGGRAVEVDMQKGVVTEIRVLEKDKKSVASTKEFSTIYDQQGQLVDSYYEQLSAAKIQTMDHHTVITRLDKQGNLTIGGNYSTVLTKHKNGVVAVKIKNGRVVEVAPLNCEKTSDVVDASNLEKRTKKRHVRDMSFIYDSKGSLVDTYAHTLPPARLQALDSHTLITRLAANGSLTIGGKSLALFNNHRRGVIAAEVTGGTVSEVSLLEAKKTYEVEPQNLEKTGVKSQIPFHLVWNQSGQLIGSFYSPHFIPRRFNRHLGKMTGPFTVDRYNGFLHAGRSYFFGDHVDYRGFPIRELRFGDPLSPGEITQFVIYDPHRKGTVTVDARSKIQKYEPEDLIIEVVFPSKDEPGYESYVPKPTRFIGRRILDPELSAIRNQEIATVREVLKQFSPAEQELLLDVALLYHDRRSKELPSGVHSFWLLREFVYEWDIINDISKEIGVPRSWIIRRFQNMRDALKSHWAKIELERKWKDVP